MIRVPERFLRGSILFCIILRKEPVMTEQQESAERASGDGKATAFGLSQATEAVDKLRAVGEQASRSIKDLTQASEDWAQEAPGRARGVGQQLREQSGRAVGTVSETVQHNPLASLAIAFAIGFLVASLIKRGP
jgi:ElaB/YqjD/DUF883 family membrane-anchored ribosome-binding protein